MRLQNAIAALVFAMFLACCVCMQLLNLFPANDLLWYLNITYAREARPVLELFSHLPLASLVQNCLILLALIALCGMAIRHRSRILTAATHPCRSVRRGFCRYCVL